MLIDTHSHIYSTDFIHDRDEIIQRAYSNDVRKIILPNIDSSSVKNLLDMVDTYPHICIPLMGLHPTSVNHDYQEELQVVEYWLKKRKFYGIGEIGIDLYWETSFLEEQIHAFRFQLKLAREYQLPVVIHVRDSFEQVYNVLLEEKDKNLTGVFHSFSGTIEQAQLVIDLGFKIGVNGIITFKKSGLDEVISKIDPSNLLLETDSPYLTPVPFRGKRNESSYLVHIAQKIADLHQMTVGEIAKITTENARKLFGI
ncbi:MAG: TatD family hydrolase [Bacteroidota bacterium]|nr:TatD family hydrolase [Bacteroidota bacterium]MDP3432547.1 TatD family hydrolase [Bacteroidota bacterium]